MPIIKSAKKRVKTSKKSHLRNISIKSKVKRSLKKTDTSFLGNKEDEIVKNFKESFSFLDKAASKGVIPKNTVSNKKSKLAKKLNSAGIDLAKVQKALTEKKLETKKTAKSKSKLAAKKITKTEKTTETKTKSKTEKTKKPDAKSETKKKATIKKKPETKKTAKSKSKLAAKKITKTEKTTETKTKSDK